MDLCNIATEDPELFEQAAKEYYEENIKKLCGDDPHCQWRQRMGLRRLNNESKKIKDPIVRMEIAKERLINYVLLGE